ncbi:hypothetical protein D3C81_1447960 [compost metagenome]
MNLVAEFTVHEEFSRRNRTVRKPRHDHHRIAFIGNSDPDGFKLGIHQPTHDINLMNKSVCDEHVTRHPIWGNWITMEVVKDLGITDGIRFEKPFELFITWVESAHVSDLNEGALFGAFCLDDQARLFSGHGQWFFTQYWFLCSYAGLHQISMSRIR